MLHEARYEGKVFVKHVLSRGGAQRELDYLTAVQGAGVVPLAQSSHSDAIVLGRTACSLADVLAESGPLPLHQVEQVGAAVAQALARVHESGLVHG